MTLKLPIKPRFVVFAAFVIAIIMFVTAYIEIGQSKRDMLQALNDEAISLIETIDRSGETIILSNAEIENLIATHLVNIGRTIADMESSQNLTEEQLSKLARQNEIAHITIYDRKARLVACSEMQSRVSEFLGSALLKDVQPLLDGTTESRIFGLIDNPIGEGTRYLVAVARSKKSGFILLELDPKYLLEYRKRVGLGRLIQDISDNEDIVYVVLQDSSGILTASRNVASMTKIQTDSFLTTALTKDSILNRITSFEGKEIYEVVKPFYLESSFYGVFRLGLSLGRLQAFHERTIQRFIILSIAFILVGVVVFSFLSVTQRHAVLKEDYQRIQTYTESILDNMADAVIATQHSGQITVFNKTAERLFRLSAKNVLGKKCSAVINDPTSCIERTLTTGHVIEYEEAEYITKIGGKLVVAVSTSILRNHAGAIDTVVAVIKDLTERRKMEDQLRRQEKLSAMGELASGVAHEIRNPLNSISMTVQRFAKDFEPKAYQDEYNALVKMMQEEVQRVSGIIQQFLQFARPPKLNPSMVDMGEFVRDVISMVESESRVKDIGLSSTLGFTGRAQLDRSQMKQVMLNLIQNAFQAIGEHGTVSISTNLVNGELHLVVADSGSGIPPELLPKIFNLYFTTKSDGIGLGLSMAHQIVSEHGGRIEVESKVGKGTVFTILLPSAIDFAN